MSRGRFAERAESCCLGRRLRLVAAASDSLEQIIRDELRVPVSELVRRVVVELVREQLNGDRLAKAQSAVSGPENAQTETNGPGETSDSPQTSTGLKTCRVCGEQKAARAFERGRRQCRQCRRGVERRSRERRAAAVAARKAEKEPHPDAKEPHPDAKAPHPVVKAPTVDRWLVDRGLAEDRDGELVATAEGLELGAVFE